MRTLIFHRAGEIPAELWDAAAPPDFFFQRAFLRAMVEGDVEEARYRYLVLLENEAVAGLAVLSAFTLRLDLLASDPWIRRLRQVSGSLLDVPIICCGIPASFGQHHLHLPRPVLAGTVVNQVHNHMEAWAAERGCGLLFWKEWNPQQEAYPALIARGYVPLPTLPDYRMRPWLPARNSEKIGAFLETLRSPYRRKYRAAALLLNGSGPVWEAGPLRFDVMPFEPAHAPPFFEGYRRVIERASARLETYRPAFFEALARSGLDVKLVRLTHREHDQSISALLVAGGNVLTFILTSKEQARYRGGLYSMLLQCIVLLGVRGGFSEVRLGQTSGYAKGMIGADCWRLETLVRATSAWKHRLIGRLGSTLFPEAESRHFNVYHHGHRPVRPRQNDPVLDNHPS